MEDVVRSEIESILNRQELDAVRRIDQGWYYGDTGEIVLGSLEHARDAIDASIQEAVRINSLAPVLTSLLQAKQAYKAACSFDDDGYGLATFNEIIREIREVQVRFGERRSRYLSGQVETEVQEGRR